MTIALGIDTGGTYTDAALIDHETNRVLAEAKSLTTRRDLAIGIRQAITGVLEKAEIRPEAIELAALSTTLATNAIVEGQGSSVCLILIGYDPKLVRQFNFESDLVTDDVVYIDGGHDMVGDQVRPLDEAAVRQAIQDRIGKVEAFAVSSYFSVRNPAHECRVRELVEEMTGQAGGASAAIPVTCGHELSSRLNSIRRATTATLNARLIPLLKELIANVHATLEEKGIHAPLMVVKGDGSLVRSDWALRRPIETILSGPAASVIGAWHLAGRKDVWVVDVGGTTTDIAALRDGLPRLNPLGARVGKWQTMVEAVDVHTVGLGGDSHVQIDQNKSSDQLSIGPRRVVPLCLLASNHPQIVNDLKIQSLDQTNHRLAGQFLILNRTPSRIMDPEDETLLGFLNKGPISMLRLESVMQRGYLYRRQLERLESERVILRSGFTPTDALHCLGQFSRWNCEASRLGAVLLAGQLKLQPDELCRRVVAGVSNRVTFELVTKVLNDEGIQIDWEKELAAYSLLIRALDNRDESDLKCRLSLEKPIVAIGAPVEAFFPRVGGQLHTEIVIPAHAGVANAVGAVAGSVVQQTRILIHPLEGGQVFRAHLPDGILDFSSLDAAIESANEIVAPYLEKQTRQAGADHVEIKVSRIDHVAPVRAGWGSQVYLDTELFFTAAGRPGLV